MSTESTRRHVFISHHHKDDATVDKMTKLLEKHGSDTRNSSIRAKPANQERLDRGLVKAATIQRLLRMKMSWAGAVVVIIGKETHLRPWVNWEIQEAERQGKRIVGVWEEGGKDYQLPTNLDAYADAIVGWQADQIMGAIDGKINNWRKPDGSSPPPRSIKRITCQ
ncbi:TIR domain-containing protein [Phragmitibacter flavus]|uniref:TIR domain-containing protein n=1 Tax=Phragmitibacter flavus TaxID=2576071 RepID=A0A5R8KH90_9BACT|nr:TIR domain-containing protein [Phragmitibacter flavus]TLD71684.1 TIR domain-containing protein [Phragmitibacter flavus]